MRKITIIFGVLVLIVGSCKNQPKQESNESNDCIIVSEEYSDSIEIQLDNNNETKIDETIEKHDSLFTLTIRENFVKIIPPKNSDFGLSDDNLNPEPFKFCDFNADGKEDILVNLGACGTGGCLYGLFLNQYNNHYKLAFWGYLKNVEFEKDKDDLWIIESSEELSAYDPSKIKISIFKFDKSKYQYELDTTFVYHDKEVEAMMKE